LSRLSLHTPHQYPAALNAPITSFLPKKIKQLLGKDCFKLLKYKLVLNIKSHPDSATTSQLTSVNAHTEPYTGNLCVADPHQGDADLDPDLTFHPGPYPTFQINAHPEPDSTFHSTADPVPDPTFQFDTDPYPTTNFS
jgi:hypothetical protein